MVSEPEFPDDGAGVTEVLSSVVMQRLCTHQWVRPPLG